MEQISKKSSQLAVLIKKTAQKLVGNPKTIQRELKKLALTLPLMALLVEEVRAAQKKVSIDATSLSGGDVFEDETALAEFVEAQDLDAAQYAELEQELGDVLLAQNDTAAPSNIVSDHGALIESIETAVGHGFAAESFELAGLVIPVAPGPLLAGVLVTGVVASNAFNGAGSGDTTTQADGTNLSTSLKDLQKLGVDFVQPASGASVLNVVLGEGDSLTSTAGIPLFGDINRDGTISAAEDSALSVNLTISSASQLAEVATLDGLSALGIDSVRIDLASQDLLNALATPSTLSDAIQTLRNNGLSVDTLNMANNTASLTTAQAHELIESGLSFATDDTDVTVNAALSADHTHLATSLKELHKLGVDNVAVTGSTAVNLDFGDGSAVDLAHGGLPLFDSNLDVTLHVANASQLDEVAALANTSGVDLRALGLDHVQLDLASQAQFDQLFGNSVSTQLDAAITTLRDENVDISTIDFADNAGNISISAAQAQTLMHEELHFAANDHISLDVSAAQATQLGSTLADIHKLGVDTLTVHDQAADGSHIDTAHLDALALAAHNAGFEHLGFLSSDLQQNQNLLAAVENFDWAHSGLKFTVEVDSITSVANNDSLSDVFNAITGIDLITGTGLTDGETWGTLIHTLQQSGLGDIDVQKSAGNTVHISDDLSAALYESGMLHALPDAVIAIDAGANKVLNTSLKAMADLGVDRVNADHKVYVELGIQVADIHTLADLGDLFSAFGLDSSAPDTQLFGTQGAGLVVNQAAFDHFSAMSPADVQTLLGELSKLGFTEVDVMGTSQVSAVYNINVTAQTPVLSQVAIIGADTTNDLTHVFDPDILTKTVK